METDNYTDTSSDDANEHYKMIASEILFAIICTVGLLGNSLVIYVIARYSKMQTVTNMYIINLAIADELFLILMPFLMTTVYLKRWVFGEFMCKTFMTLTSINQFTSSTLLCIMSGDRYIAVCHPISSPRWRTPCISKVVSLIAWIWSVALMIPIAIHTEQVARPDGYYSCHIFSPKNTTGTDTDNSTSSSFQTVRYFTLYSFSLGFAAPLCLILVFYYLVVRKLKTVGPQHKSKEKKRSHRKVTKLVLTVIAVYIFCWLPYWLYQLAFLYEDDPPEIVGIVTSFLSYSNSAVNPILYAFLSENFKKSFLKACICAADKDNYGAVCMETSIFPGKSKSECARVQPARASSLVPSHDEEFDGSILGSKYDSTLAITTASRLSIDSSARPKGVTFRNGESISEH